MQFVDHDLVVVSLHIVDYAGVDELLDVRGVITPSDDCQLFHFRRPAVVASGYSLANAVEDPECLSLEFEDVLAGAWHELEFRLAFLWLEYGLPPFEVLNLDPAPEVSIILDQLVILHKLVHPLERLVIVLDRNLTVHFGPYLFLQDVHHVV